MVGIDKVLARPDLVSKADLSLMVVFCSIALYNALETLAIIFDVFKRCRGLYFWSMQAATWGIIFHLVFVITSSYGYQDPTSAGSLLLVGYYVMTTAPLVVLYSRLHFIVPDHRKIRWVLYMIIVLACIMVIPLTVSFAGSIHKIPSFVKSYPICSRVALTTYCVAEIVLSGLYVWEAYVNLKPVLAVKNKEGRKMMVSLILLWLFLTGLLTILLVLDYLGIYFVEVAFSPFVYSLKLKMEFGILTKLLNLIQATPDSCQRLQQLSSSHDSHTLRLEPYLPPSNQTPSTDQRCPMPPWHSLREMEEGSPRSQTEMNKWAIPVSAPPQIMSSERLAAPDCRV